MPADGFAVLLALLGIIDRTFQCRLADADARQTDEDTRAFEQLQCLEQTASGVAQNMSLRRFGLVKEQLAGRCAHKAQLAQLAAFIAALVAIDDDHGNPVVQITDHDGKVRLRPVGNPELLPGNENLVALAFRTGLDLAHVRTDFRFGDAGGANPFAAQEGLEVGLFLCRVTQEVDRKHRMALDQHGNCQIGPDARQLFVKDAIGHTVYPGAAVLFRDQPADQPEFLDLGEQGFHCLRVGRVTKVLVFLDQRHELRLGHLAEVFQQHALSIFVSLFQRPRMVTQAAASSTPCRPPPFSAMAFCAPST